MLLKMFYTQGLMEPVRATLQLHVFILMSPVFFIIREEITRTFSRFLISAFLSLSLFLSVCPALSVWLPLILLPQLPPAALITTSTKYPVENTSSLIRDCSILSVQRHYFLSRRLGYQTRERLQGALLIH